MPLFVHGTGGRLPLAGKRYPLRDRLRHLQLARFVSNPGEMHYAAAVRVLIYLQGTMDRELVYQPDATLYRPL